MCDARVKRRRRWRSRVTGGHGSVPPGKHRKNDEKSPILMGESTMSMAIFTSNVCLPEGNYMSLLDKLSQLIWS